jgi:hypothetical protein
MQRQQTRDKIREIGKLNGIPQELFKKLMDNIAYIMPLH